MGVVAPHWPPLRADWLDNRPYTTDYWTHIRLPWPRSVHLQDLLALKPEDEELERARAWVESQDINPQCADWVKEVIRRVRDDR